MFGHRGTAETAQLRKDEPDPVGPLPTGPQLVYHGIENRLLRRHEALEIELVGHLNEALSPRREQHTLRAKLSKRHAAATALCHCAAASARKIRRGPAAWLPRSGAAGVEGKPRSFRPGFSLAYVRPKIRFAPDSLLEGARFEPSVPRTPVSSLHPGARDTTHGAIVKVRNADPVASTELAERFVAGLGRLSH
jgi:hypothetical protein